MFRTKSSPNDSGFTLIELCVAMLIMLVGLLGLLQSVNIALEYNLKNQLRGEAMRIAQNTMNKMRATAFDSVDSGTDTVKSSLRNISRSYTVVRTVDDTGTGVTKRYQVDVKWVEKNVTMTHSIMSVRSRIE